MMIEPEAKEQTLSEIGDSECSSLENNPKRARMESGSGSSERDRPESEELPPQRQIINTCIQDFTIIKNMPGFVDHTHFIRSFLLRENATLAIFAPRRFGKSSHLHMLKTFLSCVSESTQKPYEKMDRPPEERENYAIFKKTKIIKDGNCKDILEKHLGKHPIIHLDFKGAPPIYNVEDAKTHFRNAVQEAYKEHPYLITSQKLCTDGSEANAVAARGNCEKWCNDLEYEKQNLDKCLLNLSRYLYNHFDRAKVYVLVDEFDAINSSALESVKGDRAQKSQLVKEIGKVVTSSLCRITKGLRLHVAGILITGVSYIAGVGCSPDLNNFTRLRFLEGDSILPSEEGFVPFYGATEEEVRSLVEKLVQDDQLVNFRRNVQVKLDADEVMLDVKTRYNGYLDKNGTRIFCLWSVLQYLQSGEPKNFWHETDGLKVKDIRNVFQCTAVALDVLKLIRGDIITFERNPGVDIEELLQLEEFIADYRRDVNRTVLFTFLVDQGFVSYAEDKNQGKEQFFKIPNSEIRAAFSHVLHEILKEWDFDAMSCAELVDKLSKQDDENTLKEKMLAIHAHLKREYKKLALKKLDHITEATFTSTLNAAMNKSSSFDVALESHMKKHGKRISSGRPDLLLLHKSSNFCVLWELKHNKEEKDGKKRKSKTSKYALQEARGKEYTKSKKANDYMKTIEVLELDALYVGLSVDGNFNVSLSYASNNEEKIFCITKKEKELHSEYYSGCEMLPVQESDSDTE